MRWSILLLPTYKRPGHTGLHAALTCYCVWARRTYIHSQVGSRAMEPCQARRATLPGGTRGAYPYPCSKRVHFLLGTSAPSRSCRWHGCTEGASPSVPSVSIQMSFRVEVVFSSKPYILRPGLGSTTAILSSTNMPRCRRHIGTNCVPAHLLSGSRHVVALASVPRNSGYRRKPRACTSSSYVAC